MMKRIKPIRTVMTATSLGLLTCALLGCGKPTAGVLSHSDYAYAADTLEQVSQARARFDRAVQLFQSAGLQPVSVSQTGKRSETVLRAPGKEAQLAFMLPDNGLATITLAYKSEGAGSQAKTEAETLLARAQDTLNPN